jgi:hypothetical protein
MADMTFSNDRGGTVSVPPGQYIVLVERVWEDYEIGVRGAGKLVSKADLSLMRKLGTTQYEPKQAWWDPAKVYFSAELEESK